MISTVYAQTNSTQEAGEPDTPIFSPTFILLLVAIAVAGYFYLRRKK